MDQIEQVRRKTDLVELIQGSGVALRKAGRNFKGLCPFHEEKTPSFMVSPERQIFKCFGCGEGGDVYGWLMKREGMEFGEALRTLADRVGIKLKSFRPSKEQQIKERLLEINHLASEYYHYLLMEHKSGKEARQYLMKRGIQKASMRLFKLGYSPNEWEGLKNYLVKKKDYKLTEVEMAGLVLKGRRGYYDRFRNRVMFSLFDHRSRVVGFAGRVFPRAAEALRGKAEEGKEAKYVNSPETVLYHKSEVLYGLERTKEEIKKANKAVVVEGELDAISSYQAGVKNVAAVKGSALTEGQVELLKRFTENLALALDEDAAGEAAATRGIETAEKAGLNVRVIRLQYGKDPDECAQKSSRLWKDSVKTAVPIYDFYIESAVERYGVKTPEGKRKVSSELAGILGRITNQVVRAHYVKKLAGMLGVGEEAVVAEVEKALLRQGYERQTVRRETEKTEKGRKEVLSEYVLALVLQMESEVGKLAKQVETKWLAEGAVKKVLRKLKEWGKSQKKWSVNQFVESLAAELVGAVDEAYLKELDKKFEDRERLELELAKTMKELKRMSLKEEMEGLTEEIREAEKQKQKQKAMKLQQKFVEVAKELRL